MLCLLAVRGRASASHALVFCVLCVLISLTITEAWSQQTFPTGPVGKITACYGDATIEGIDSQQAPRKADLHVQLNNHERIVTSGGGGVSVLLDSRVVLRIDGESSVRVIEGIGQTTLELDRGTLHVFVGKRAPALGAVGIVDGNGRAELSSGVLFADFDPATRDGYYACEQSTASLQTLHDEHPLMLRADSQASVHEGKLVSVDEIDRAELAARKESLDRIGQATAANTTETFRVRMRSRDVSVALSELSASGWIKAEPAGSPSPTPGSGGGEPSPNEGGGGNETPSPSEPPSRPDRDDDNDNGRPGRDEDDGPRGDGKDRDKDKGPKRDRDRDREERADRDGRSDSSDRFERADRDDRGKPEKGDSVKKSIDVPKVAAAAPNAPIASVPTPRDFGIDLSDLSAKLKQQWGEGLKNNTSNNGPGAGGADRSGGPGGPVGSDDRGGRKTLRQKLKEMGFKTKGHPGRGGGENSGKGGGDHDD